MSMGLSVFLLDPSATHALVGSCDDQLLEVIRDKFADDLARDDDWFRDQIDQGAPTAYEALRTVVHGGPFPTGGSPGASQYGYAYKRLCSLTGSHLDNSSFCPYRSGWLEAVDEGLRTIGVTAVSVAGLGGWDGLPKGVPWSEFPGCGEWTHEECATAFEQFEAGDRADRGAGLAPEVFAAVSDCARWVAAAARRPGYGVIGFQS
ncbi:hypothetical protein [Streptomyces sp. VRA16 Mangrove soil]|uniref:DUF7691 family protein n=1 Tax=Streptomyces sp. VRA16 Mangrove soil TaxID=2817434 RepID=UPI001A9FFC42|nr:hypothetical protein [Streptomyces sp. VRA16 Mangrove soil]MBO1330230.1 hypothetical protein [Streptomyces sp. VRA16 Mangrove soil]